MKEKRIDKEISQIIKENFEGLFNFEYAPNGVIVAYKKGGLNNEAIFDLEEGCLNIFNKDNLLFEKNSSEMEKNPSFWAGVIAGMLMGL